MSKDSLMAKRKKVHRHKYDRCELCGTRPIHMCGKNICKCGKKKP